MSIYVIFNRIPLHYAASNGHIFIVECLIANKANINAKDIDVLSQHLIILLYIMLQEMDT